MKLWHITFISFKKDTADSLRKEFHLRLKRLGEDCGGLEAGIIYWSVKKNTDLRKGVHLVLISIFENAEALEKYKQHPKHKEFSNLLRDIADWQVGDIWNECPRVPVSLY